MLHLASFGALPGEFPSRTRIPGRLQQCNTFGISPLEMDRDRNTANVVWKC